MEQLTDLNAILHSKRANIYYLEKCRIMQKDGRVLYLQEAGAENRYWNIPIANTVCLLLGIGTSITQAAVRMLAKAGVIIGFCGSGGTPLLMATEVEWLSPQSEYRPTKYLQGWMSFWFDDMKRLEAAKILQNERIDFLINTWKKDRDLISEGFLLERIENPLKSYRERCNQAININDLLQTEARLTKQLYKFAAEATQISEFSRSRISNDAANKFLNHGNYLAYGLGATTLWVLGIPHGFAVMHGKTRRGALVFDVADLVKDALILPWAFICAKEGSTEQEFRQQVIQVFANHNALDFMFNQVKKLALKDDWRA